MMRVMPRQTLSVDQRYESLPSPFRNGGRCVTADPETLMKQGTEFFGSGNHCNRRVRIEPQAAMKVVSTGKLQILCFKSTPCITREEGDGDSSTLAMPYAGGIHRFKDGIKNEEIAPGDIHINPRNGGSVTVRYFTGLIARLEHRRLYRTLRAISGGDSTVLLGESLVIRGKESATQPGTSRKVWSLIKYIDEVLGEDSYLPAVLGLDEQVYRSLALALLETFVTNEKIKRRWSTDGNTWGSGLDELVDYIRMNAYLDLTLTDLEEQSHYSGRHLQNLFREKFDCTPMQFVRRQRLSMAMEKLQTAEGKVTVTSVARDCGYRHTSNFSTDFHREFGVKPSTVLRSSGGGLYV